MVFKSFLAVLLMGSWWKGPRMNPKVYIFVHVYTYTLRYKMPQLYVTDI